MNIEVWSDVVCPWCYLGKRRLEHAIAAFPHGGEVSVRWRSFELNPAAPRDESTPVSEMLERKYRMSPEQVRVQHERLTALAAEEGLEYHLDKTRSANTLDAHRLIHLAEEQGKQGPMKERLMRAYFTDALPIGSAETLVKLAVELGLEERDARALLGGDDYVQAVRADEEEARELGVNGVPFFLFEGKWGVSGAQPVEVFQQVLRQVWDEIHAANAASAGEP